MCPHNDCTDSGVQQQLFVSEIITSFIFYSSWLIIKNYEKHALGQIKEVMAYTKPLLCAAAYIYSMTFFTKAVTNYGNPVLAFSVWIWNIGIMSDKINSDPDSISEYKSVHAGRYLWIYICTPFVGSLIAGFFAKSHLALLGGDSDTQSSPRHLLPEAQNKMSHEQNRAQMDYREQFIEKQNQNIRSGTNQTFDD